MSTLLLRLKGPMQSWGVTSKFDTRTTERAPSKSAIIGMLAGALGRRRNESIDDLALLKYGVRIDSEGKLMRDYHTAKSAKSAYVTHRYYLADAAFLVGLEGDTAFLEHIRDALLYPYFPIFLGRRSCPPEGKVVLGIREVPLMDALQNEPWLNDGLQKKRKESFQYILDAMPDERENTLMRDNPISFNQEKRQFGYRRVVEISKKTNHPSDSVQTEHDPFCEFPED